MADQNAVGLVFDDRYLTHDSGLMLINYEDRYPLAEPVPHPSGPEQVGRVKRLIDLSGLGDRLTRISAVPATDEQLTAYHTPEYLERVAAVSAAGGGDVGRGAPIGLGGEPVARLSAGGVVAATDAVLSGRVRSAYALVRPPGHHAVADLGLGFCVYANVVIAARHAQRAHGVPKILIVDWDVHHGNGTQDALLSDPSVLFISLHQDNLFPSYSGGKDEVGTGPGKGFTVNLPLPAGTGNRGYEEAFDRVVGPIARQFDPDLVFISAGQDASVQDPLGRMCLTVPGYRMMMEKMQAIADETCGGKIIVAQEGGYSPTYAPYCSAMIAHTLAGDLAAGLEPPRDPYGARGEALPPTNELGLDLERALDQVLEVQRSYWSL